MPACVLEVVVGFDDLSGELSLLADQDQAPVKVTELRPVCWTLLIRIQP